jgi:predicted DNA-binding helix-hairpin-helix protein
MYKTVTISSHYAFLNKSVCILLLKIVDSFMCKWDCGIIHNLINDYARAEEEEYQEYQDPYANLDEYG